jgi:hypothetical protein
MKECQLTWVARTLLMMERRLVKCVLCLSALSPQGRLLGIRDEFTSKVAEVAISLSGPCDPQVRQTHDAAVSVMVAWCRPEP